MVEREGAKWTSDPNQATDETSGARPAAGGRPPEPPGPKEPARIPVEPQRPSLAPRVWRLVFIVLLVALGIALGFQLGNLIVESTPYQANLRSESEALVEKFAFGVLGGLLSYLLATLVFHKIVQIGENLRNMSAKDKTAIFVGLFVGFALTAMLSPVLLAIPKLGLMITMIVGVILDYLGVIAALSMKDDFRFTPSAPVAPEIPEESISRHKILDTNVIIDGRITDICRTGFIEGPVYVPGFVLDELQHIADSSDNLKRARGRRGLDILNQMRSEMPLIVRSLDSKAEYPPMEEVDAKLVRLAKKLEGMIVTNDFNLNKVAELQGVPVLNINELANALKPVVLPGEEMRVTVIKEGKEMNQGIAYLDDGTMIVIEGARRRIGENLDVVVSSVLQTVAGKMIFATIRMDEDGNYEESDRGYDGGPRGYPGGRPPRRPPGR